MRRSKFSETQIVEILKDAVACASMNVPSNLGISRIVQYWRRERDS
jgi:hypothetical protein